MQGSETTVRAKNGRLMMKFKCGITKTKFIRGQTGGLSWMGKQMTKKAKKDPVGYLLGKITQLRQNLAKEIKKAKKDPVGYLLGKITQLRGNKY